MLVGEAALNGDDAAVVDVHRHEPTLHFGDLPKGPARIVVGPAVAHDVDHVAGVEDVGGCVDAGNPAQIVRLNPVAIVIDRLVFNANRRGAVGERQHHGQMPAFNIAWQVNVGQRFTPCRLVSQHPGFEHHLGAAPFALIAVIILKGRAKGGRGDVLHFGIDGGAHGQPVALERGLAELALHLAADFVGEIVAGRQLGPESGEITALHRLQRRLALQIVGNLVEIAVLIHLAQRVVAPENGGFVVPHRVAIRRCLGQRS